MGKWIFNTQFPGETKTYKEKLIELVDKGLTGRQLSKALNVDYTCVHRWLRKLGLHLPNHHNELKFDNTIFDTIDNEEKAYWLGFMYADGYVSKNGRRVELCLKGSDIGHIEKFKKFLKAKNPIETGYSKCNGKMFPRCKITLVNEHFNKSLVKLGCIPNKSLILKFPPLSIFKSNDLVRHFIRGYVDGDGCLHTVNKNRLSIQIISTKEFLTGILNLYPSLFTKVFHKDKRHPDSNTFFISNSCRKADKFGSILYDNATIYLQRKYDKYKALNKNGQFKRAS